MARNPRTGEKVPVQAKNVLTFKPGKEMEARVRVVDLEEIERKKEAGSRNAAKASQAPPPPTVAPDPPPT
jgi:DNA-binding protein HU-beta/integration host factor subunit beta